MICVWARLTPVHHLGGTAALLAGGFELDAASDGVRRPAVIGIPHGWFDLLMVATIMVLVGTVALLIRAAVSRRRSEHELQLRSAEVEAAHARLAEQSEFIHAVVDAILSPVFVKDRDHRWRILNQAACELIGRPRDELLGKSDFDVFPESEARVFWEQDDLVLSTGRPSVNEERITGAAGESWSIQTKKTRFRDHSGDLFIVGVIEDITERQNVLAKIERINRRLADANEELESFAFSVSHDLRAPLRRIDAFSRILEEDLADTLDGTSQDALGRIRRLSQEMTDLIDALLTLSRVNRVEVFLDEIDLSGIAREELAELERDNGGRAVQSSVQPGLVAYGDRRLVRAVIRNLLSNALKFTAGVDDPTIEVGRLSDDEAARAGHEAATVYFVRDNGVGFDMADAHELFRPFKRLHNEDDFPGIGIGLATVRRIVHLHGGKVWFDSRPGIGTTVLFTLV